ncbi:hypothetical protein [Lysinibacter cavernae]|uniref:hypothetical protein n=1 Tax=Lysinibacter cavernae TaxID=1640652 RepID=UPI003607439A
MLKVEAFVSTFNRTETMVNKTSPRRLKPMLALASATLVAIGILAPVSAQAAVLTPANTGTISYAPITVLDSKLKSCIQERVNELKTWGKVPDTKLTRENVAKITYLHCDGGIWSLSGLQHLTGITQLYLTARTAPNTFSSVPTLTAPLTHVALYTDNLVNTGLSGISKLKLTDLFVTSGPKLTNLSALATMPQPTGATFRNGGLTDVSGVKHWISSQNIEFSNQNILDASPMKNHPGKLSFSNQGQSAAGPIKIADGVFGKGLVNPAKGQHGEEVWAYSLTNNVTVSSAGGQLTPSWTGSGPCETTVVTMHFGTDDYFHGDMQQTVRCS